MDEEKLKQIERKAIEENNLLLNLIGINGDMKSFKKMSYLAKIAVVVVLGLIFSTILTGFVLTITEILLNLIELKIL